MTSAMTWNPTRSTSRLAATSPTAAPAAPKYTRMPTIVSRSRFVVASSGSSASYGPPVMLLKMLKSSSTKKR